MTSAPSGTKIPVVLVGLGNMGRNHLRVIGESPDFQLAAVVEPNLRAPLPPAQANVPVYPSVQALAAARVPFDAAVVATATETHFEVASQLLELRKHLLVEKPLASTVAQARSLGKLATERGCTLAVGHVERFNPAVRKLREVIENGRLGAPIHFSVTRVGGYPQHVKPGNNVILDLAVHDIDVLRSIVGPMRLVARYCHKTIDPGIYDTAQILLESKNGVSASLHVNWITPTKIRQIRVTGSRGVCFVDYILQSCELLGGNILNDPRADFQSLIQQYQNSDRVVFGVQKEEPLKLELRAFHKALRGDSSEICTADDGAAAVELAEAAFHRESGPNDEPFI